MSEPRVRLVLNPSAGSGAAARRLPDILRAFNRHDLVYEVAKTTAPGDATRLSRAAFDDGVDIVAVAGGDGTVNEVAQAWLDARGEPRRGPALAVIPIGTGGDFKRTLGLTGSIDEAVDRMASSKGRRLDLAVMRLVGFDGADAVRAFVNITSFGIGGVTDRLVNEAPKWMGGRAAFFLGSARAMLSYRNAPVHVRVDGETFVQGPVFNVAVANGKYFGGGMMIAPAADPGDGLLDVVCLGDMTRREALSLSSKIYKGSHLGVPKVTSRRGARVEAEATRAACDVLIDMDGETPGKLPLSIRVVPGWIELRA
jgi:YegS/Rv2252/BmrU family lipid kinase